MQTAAGPRQAGFPAPKSRWISQYPKSQGRRGQGGLSKQTFVGLVLQGCQTHERIKAWRETGHRSHHRSSGQMVRGGGRGRAQRVSRSKDIQEMGHPEKGRRPRGRSLQAENEARNEHTKVQLRRRTFLRRLHTVHRVHGLCQCHGCPARNETAQERTTQVPDSIHQGFIYSYYEIV